jgi:prolyl oligopeptidase
VRAQGFRFATRFVGLILLVHCEGEPPPREPSSPLPLVPTVPAPTTPPPAPTTTRYGAPLAPKRPVTDTYFDTTVTDDYRWLESWSDPAVREWSEAQNRATRAFLDALPGRKAIHDRVEALLTAHSPAYASLVWKKAGLFALEQHPPKQQAFLVLLKSEASTEGERVLVDPNALDPSGKTTIDFFVPSRDGRLVAVSLSSGGTESGDVHIYEVATGKALPDVVTRVNGGTAGGSVAWNGDGSGFFYTRYPRPGERPPADVDFYQEVYFHKLGAPESADEYSLGKDAPRIAEFHLTTSEDGKYLLASMEMGDGGQYAHWLLDPSRGKDAWRPVAKLEDGIRSAEFGLDGNVYLLDVHGAPRGRIVRVSPTKPELAPADVVVPEGALAVERFTVTRARVYVEYQNGGLSELRAFPLRNATAAPRLVPLLTVPIPPVSSIEELVRGDGDDVLYRDQSMTEAPAWYRYRGVDGTNVKTALFETAPESDMSGAEVVRETCTSKDGTSVPMTILRNKGTALDGTNPTLLTGYGGFGLSRIPRFRPIRKLWLEHGGVIVDTNLRGGNEFGEAWHDAGRLTRKQNVFDDFLACARRLIDERYTSPAKLAIIGGSNGGLLMGAAMTQAPELFRAVVSYVGYYDMLRFETAPNGAFNATEYGSVKDPEQFKALYAYSPYQHVKDGAVYPAALFLTGANDPRVDPFHSRKFVARLQAATGGEGPILLRTSGDTGHGIGSPLGAQIEEESDVYAFLVSELGVK